MYPGNDYGEKYDNMKLTCKGIYKCWDNAQKDTGKVILGQDVIELKK